jgi:hypothetical protein
VGQDLVAVGEFYSEAGVAEALDDDAFDLDTAC